MKWLAYVVLVLGVVAMGVAGFRLGRAHEREWGEVRPPDPTWVPAPTTPVAPVPAPPKVTVDGKPVPPEEAEAIHGAFRDMLGRAVAAAVNKSLEDLVRQLRLNGEMEHKLLVVLDRFGPDVPEDGPFLIAIHLIRPGAAGRPAEDAEARFGERATIRLTRATAGIDRPVAVTTVTYLTGTRLTQRSRFLAYAPDGEWQDAEPGGKPDRGGSRK